MKDNLSLFYLVELNRLLKTHTLCLIEGIEDAPRIFGEKIEHKVDI